MAKVCFACGKKIGMFTTDTYLDNEQHMLCQDCYSKIGWVVNQFKYVVSGDNADPVSAGEKRSDVVQAIESAGYSDEVKKALLEEVDSLLDKLSQKRADYAEKVAVGQEKKERLANIKITSGFGFEGYKIKTYVRDYLITDAVYTYTRKAGKILDSITKKYDEMVAQLVKEAIEDGCNAITEFEYKMIPIEPELPTRFLTQ